MAREAKTNPVAGVIQGRRGGVDTPFRGPDLFVAVPLPPSSDPSPVPAESAATEPSACFDVFVARQPIFQLDGQVSAYELLYRKSGESQTAQHASAEVMAAEVLVQTFLNIGLDRVTGDARAFLNFTRDMLLQGMYGLFDPKRVVIEVLETVTPDEDVVATIETMVRNGYTVALDDFETRQHTIVCSIW